MPVKFLITSWDQVLESSCWNWWCVWGGETMGGCCLNMRETHLMLKSTWKGNSRRSFCQRIIGLRPLMKPKNKLTMISGTTASRDWLEMVEILDYKRDKAWGLGLWPWQGHLSDGKWLGDYSLFFYNVFDVSGCNVFMVWTEKDSGLEKVLLDCSLVWEVQAAAKSQMFLHRGWQ